MLKWEEVQEQIDELMKRYLLKYHVNVNMELEEWIQHQYQAYLLKGYDCWSKYKDLPIEESR
ncbi:hypothetical protein AB432_030170 [Brevibacillus brevis]|uniref:Uncharacterized protein n=1 Tax=Brevibacillus brevis TaxID=1393 RepID=A0A2Z4MR78_BREBE|nr:hypothetical protein [Brevibacillus brevis]AWX59054.1 hypothetical protein AB432_030170 [Brevibacillus brevis]